MSVQILKIVQEEFTDARKVLDESNTSNSLKEVFETVRKQIAWRIERECIDQDEPFDVCDTCGLRHDQNLACEDLSRYELNGLTPKEHAEEYDESIDKIIADLKQHAQEYNEPVCRFCAKNQAECTGSGYDDGIQAHDFTPNGPTKDPDGYFDEDPDGRTLKEVEGGLETQNGEHVGCVLFERKLSGHMPEEVHSAEDDDGYFDDDPDGRTLKVVPF